MSVAVRSLPLATNIVGMHKGSFMTYSSGSRVAVADQFGVDVYDTAEMDPRLDIRRQKIIFSTKTIPLKMLLSELEPPSRISCILLQSNYLWVGLYDGAVRVWHYGTGELITGIRRKSTRVPVKMVGDDDSVTISWSDDTNLTTSAYSVQKQMVWSWSSDLTKRHLKSVQYFIAEQEQTISWTCDSHGLIPKFEKTSRYQLTYTRNVMEVVPLNSETSGRRLTKSFETFKMTAGTIVEFGDSTCVFAALINADGSSLICRIDLNDQLTVTLPGFTKQEMTKVAKLKDATITAMVMYQDMLALFVTTLREGSRIFFMCPRTFQRFHDIELPNGNISRSEISILNSGRDSETLLVLSGNFRVQMVTPKWKFHKTAMAHAIASSKKKQIVLPSEVWFHALRFL